MAYTPGDKLVIKESTTTSAGNVGGTTLLDSVLIQENDWLSGLTIEIVTGSASKETRKISSFNTADGTITVSSAFSAQIASSVSYRIWGLMAPADATVANQALILADTEKLYDVSFGVSPADGSLASFIATGGTALGTRLPASKSIYDFLLTTDNNYSTVTANWNAAAQTVFEIASDTRYEVIGISVDLTGTTNASTWTFQFNRAYAASGASYRTAGDAITKVVGTGSVVIEFNNWDHYGYTKLTAQSDAAGDDGKTITFTRITKPLE